MSTRKEAERGGGTKSPGNAVRHQNGDPGQNAKTWGGGSKGSKGPVTHEDKRNQKSSQKS